MAPFEGTQPETEKTDKLAGNEEETQETGEEQQTGTADFGSFPGPIIHHQYSSESGQEEEEEDKDVPPMKDPFEEVPSQEGVYLVKEYRSDFKIFRWKITDWMERGPNKLYSDVFEVGDFPWRILVFPKGNGVNDVSMYLDVADARAQQTGWIRHAEFKLGILNQKNIKRSHFMESSKRFYAHENDWGFRNFLPVKDVEDTGKGFLGEDGSIVIEARVDVKKENLKSYSMLTAYDSRKETGYVGLKNQGATCYMNSLLQTLFHVSYFRKQVYSLPTQDEPDPEKSIPLALQRLFYNLQFGNSPVSTKLLTKSFGWDAMDTFMQHDVQELARVLLDNLENKMKGTPSENTMEYLLKGLSKSYIKCIDVDYESSREEPFYDIQLVVKDRTGVIDSLKHDVEEELLAGNNQYHAEGHGYQDAKKGTTFLKFPPVLMLHLRRFEYDFMRDQMYKVNDRYEFPETLDLDEFLSPEANSTTPNKYNLHSVLVHSGDTNGGHYYAYIKPKPNGDWFKFDDERVYKATPEEALDENFGGEAPVKDKKEDAELGYGSVVSDKRISYSYKKFSNAYMLVYVREYEEPQILEEVTEEDLPRHLVERFTREREEEEKRKREKAEAHLYVNVRIITEEELLKYNGVDVVPPLEEEDRIKLKKETPLEEVLNVISEKTSIPADKLRIWRFEHRQNRTYRSDGLPKTMKEKTALDRVFNLPASASNLDLYVEEVDEDALPQTDETAKIFFKKYDPEKEELRIVGSGIFKRSEKISKLYDKISEIENAPASDFTAFEEIKPNMIEVMNESKTIAQSELVHGDICVYQRLVEEPSKYKYPEAPDYYSYIVNRIVVKFCKPEEPKTVQVELELLKTMSYNEVTSRLGEELKHPGDNIRITGHSTYTENPKTYAFKTTDPKNLKEMLSFGNYMSDILYYELLDEPVAELEKKKTVTVSWYNDRVEEEKTFSMTLPKTSTIEHLLNELRKNGIELKGSKQIRLLEVFQHKIHKIFKETDTIEWLHDYAHITLRAEEIPEEELNMDENEEKVIHIQHFVKESNISARAFGAPFFLVVKKTDTLKEVKEKIKQKLGIEDEEFEKWKWATLYFSRPEYLKDEDVVVDELKRVATYRIEATLGMEHKDTSPPEKKSNSYSRFYSDKPIKIYN